MEDNKVELFGSVATSSKLNAGVLKVSFLFLYNGCDKPFLLILTLCAIPLCAPLLHLLTIPPATVTATCNPQQIAKIFLIFFLTFSHEI